MDEDEETKYAREIKEKKMELMRLQKLKIEKELEAMRKAVLDTENSKEDPLAKVSAKGLVSLGGGLSNVADNSTSKQGLRHTHVSLG